MTSKAQRKRFWPRICTINITWRDMVISVVVLLFYWPHLLTRDTNYLNAVGRWNPDQQIRWQKIVVQAVIKTSKFPDQATVNQNLPKSSTFKQHSCTWWLKKKSPGHGGRGKGAPMVGLVCFPGDCWRFYHLNRFMTGHILYPIMPSSVFPGLRDVEAEMPLRFLPVAGTTGQRERGQGPRDKGERRERGKQGEEKVEKEGRREEKAKRKRGQVRERLGGCSFPLRASCI